MFAELFFDEKTEEDKKQKKIMLDLFEYGIVKYYQEIKRRAPKKNYILIRYITYFIHQPLNYYEI